jgi:hypothetical protein
MPQEFAVRKEGPISSEVDRSERRVMSSSP